MKYFVYGFGLMTLVAIAPTKTLVAVVLVVGLSVAIRHFTRT